MDNIIPPILAHRGASALAPENTLSAFLKAKQLGIQWIEFDVMLTACGEVIVFHDETLNRTTNGSGNVNDYTYDYLKTLDAGSWFNSRFAGEKIPTLREVLVFLSEYQMSANIEIKALPGQEESLVHHVLDLINDYEKTALLVSSFSLEVLQLVRKDSQKISIGVLMDEWHDNWQQISDQLNAAAVDVNQQILNPARIHEIKATNRLLLTYTVNNLIRAKELLSWGVNAIFSDCPREMLTLINQN